MDQDCLFGMGVDVCNVGGGWRQCRQREGKSRARGS